MYQLIDEEDELVLGSFYESELLYSVPDPSNPWTVKDGQYVGWPSFYNQWIPSIPSTKE